MKSLNIIELIKLKSDLEDNNLQDDFIYTEVKSLLESKFDNLKNETTSAVGGPSGGMGAVVSAQPSGLAGQTIGTSWASNGGTTGSGDISVPYNPGGSNRVFHQIPSQGKNHGPRTGKKSRKKNIDLKQLKKFLDKSKDDDNVKSGKVMNYDDFVKKNINKK
jgi:hypothetical protein